MKEEEKSEMMDMPDISAMMGFPVQIDKRQYVALVNNFIGGMIQDKMMMVYESSELGVVAGSQFIGNEKYEIRTNSIEQYIVFRLEIIDPVTNAHKERMMKFSFTDIIRDTLISQAQDLKTVWDRQWDTLRKIDDKQWEQLTSKRKEGKLTFTNPQLK